MRKPPPIRKVSKALPSSAARLTSRQQKALVPKTSSLLRNMQERIRKKRKDPEYVLPIARDLFRLAAVDAVGFPCPYCREKLSVPNLSADHRIPLSRGGSDDLSNIEFICKSCNTAKGEMTHEEFARLLAVLSEFEASVSAQILGRLKAGASVQRLRFLRR